MAGITYRIDVETQQASKAVEKFKKEMASNDDALRLGRLQIEMDKERIAGNDALSKKIASQIELEKELIAIRSRGGLLGQTGAMELQAKERAAQREMEIDRELAASAQQKAQLDADILAKGTAANANTLKLTGLQTQADRARVQGKELEAKKLEHQITLERELIRIQGLGGTQQQRDQMAAHARAQTVLADKQAEIAQAQKLANIQRGNMPGQAMSDGAKRFRMMNVSAQLQDVAVQAQMGTAMSTIVGQQAPQLISALGGTGAMAGAAAGAAIGIAIVTGIGTAVINSEKQFHELVDGAKRAATEISKISFSAKDQAGLERGAELYREQVQKMQEAKLASSSKASRLIGWIDENTGGESAQEKENQKKAARNAIEFAYTQMQERSLKLSENAQERAKLIAEDDKKGLETLDKKEKLEQRIFDLRMSKLGPEAIKAAVAAEEATAAAEKTRDAKREALDEEKQYQEEMNAALKDQYDAEDKAAKEIEDLRDFEAKQKRQFLGEQQKAEEQNAKEIADIQKRAADKDAADRTKAAADFSKIEDERKKKLEDRLKIDEKMALSQDRLKKAQEEYKRTANGSLAQEQAAAKVAAAKMEVEDRREAQIQRAMGGSIAEGAARRSERAEQRARARAERIVTNREVNEKRAEMERKRMPQREIDAALDAIRGAKKPDVKDAQKEVVGAIDKTNGKLDELLKKLTIA